VAEPNATSWDGLEVGSYINDSSIPRSLNLDSPFGSILKIILAKMDKKRIIPVIAFTLTIAAFILSLTTLLVGITGNNSKSPAILTVRLQTLCSKPAISLKQYHEVQHLLPWPLRISRCHLSPPRKHHRPHPTQDQQPTVYNAVHRRL